MLIPNNFLKDIGVSIDELDSNEDIEKYNKKYTKYIKKDVVKKDVIEISFC